MKIAIGIFFVLVGVGLGYACLRLAGLFGQLTTMVGDVDREVVPILNRLQTTVDEVNSELGKIDEITGSVVNVTGTLEDTTAAVQSAVTAPIKAAASVSAGVSRAFSTFFGARRKES
jgi:ABC-type transporter Mla subunit MlaD